MIHMSLYNEWQELCEKERTEEEYNKFWNTYLEKEMKIYEFILDNHEEVVEGKLAELAEKFDMEPVVFTGFMDGINTSLKESVKLEELSEESNICLKVDFEKLYYNMLDAKAYWLYNLPQWDNILSQERRNEITKEYNRAHIAVSNKIGRNEPCICGSGKKYKKCCGA
ncbi:protein export cytoplasm protein SecA ATPase RNA helicase [Acetivibrio straminisolvens JCM 21531]|uniref:Protein export cytoplasm protein SecA ATPase RNA helicase n=2 Tax=Acetivibrio straminisolvens TaxID=253314 RepID=W4V6X5_9FIRM|nr:SEC-C metal-binding domain-containing protein [Acetivibrio straminisolvens]GAE88573.1 protein export cytoplasm protein SecA ATPase RNA helicase [Acetivibrio straminisolvens JCM 21531]